MTALPAALTPLISRFITVENAAALPYVNFPLAVAYDCSGNNADSPSLLCKIVSVTGSPESAGTFALASDI